MTNLQELYIGGILFLLYTATVSRAEVCSYTSANSPVSLDCKKHGCCGEGKDTTCCESSTLPWYTILSIVSGCFLAIIVLVIILMCIATHKNNKRARVHTTPHRATPPHMATVHIIQTPMNPMFVMPPGYEHRRGQGPYPTSSDMPPSYEPVETGAPPAYSKSRYERPK